MLELTKETAIDLIQNGVQGWKRVDDNIYETEDDGRQFLITRFYNKEINRHIEINWMYHPQHDIDQYWSIREVTPVIKPVTVYELVGEQVEL